MPPRSVVRDMWHMPSWPTHAHIFLRYAGAVLANYLIDARDAWAGLLEEECQSERQLSYSSRARADASLGMPRGLEIGGTSKEFRTCGLVFLIVAVTAFRMIKRRRRT